MRKKFKVLKITALVLGIIIGVSALTAGGFFIWATVRDDAPAGGYEWDSGMKFLPESGGAIDTGGEKFKILILTDLHYSGSFGDERTDKLVKKAVADGAPDLIVLVGDNCFTLFNTGAYGHIIGLFDGFGIPWTLIFGNHDAEGKGTKNKLAQMLRGGKYCLFEYGPRISGANGTVSAGNYFINLKRGDEFIHTLYFLDSDSQKNGEYPPYSDGQVEFYGWAEKGMTEAAGKTVPSTLFCHIPLPEYAAAYDEAAESDAVLYGKRREKECAADINSGLFGRVLQSGGTKGIFCGHDHVNDYSVAYKGVRLTYALKSGFGSYGDDAVRGYTVLSVDENGSTEQEQRFVRF